MAELVPVRSQIARRGSLRHHHVQEAGIGRSPFQDDRHKAPGSLIVDHLRVEAPFISAERIQVHRPRARVAASDDCSRRAEDGDMAIGDLHDAVEAGRGMGVRRGVDEAVAISLHAYAIETCCG